MSNAHCQVVVVSTLLASHLAGVGSYGTVHKAVVRATGELVAIKEISVGPADDLTHIQKEIDMLRECQHPNIVRYLVCAFSLRSFYRQPDHSQGLNYRKSATPSANGTMLRHVMHADQLLCYACLL